MDTRHCLGCRDDFYNGKNPYGIAECWMLKDAELATRYQLHKNAPMGERRGYVKVRRPQCYYAPEYIYRKAIPDYAR